ncbi:MAG: hypothetical protein HN976_36675 [Lentisphaerae bacterium]|nr:hypothetical protein [Lentisphaerota bacterium]
MLQAQGRLTEYEQCFNGMTRHRQSVLKYLQATGTEVSIITRLGLPVRGLNCDVSDLDEKIEGISDRRTRNLLTASAVNGGVGCMTGIAIPSAVGAGVAVETGITSGALVGDSTGTIGGPSRAVYGAFVGGVIGWGIAVCTDSEIDNFIREYRDNYSNFLSYSGLEAPERLAEDWRQATAVYASVWKDAELLRSAMEEYSASLDRAHQKKLLNERRLEYDVRLKELNVKVKSAFYDRTARAAFLHVVGKVLEAKGVLNDNEHAMSRIARQLDAAMADNMGNTVETQTTYLYVKMVGLLKRELGKKRYEELVEVTKIFPPLKKDKQPQ